MSIASKLQELDAAKDDIFDAIEAKGVTVPAGSGLADVPALIGSIPTGGGGGGDLPEGYTEVYVINNTNGTTASPVLLVFYCDATTHDYIECQFLFTRTDTNFSYPVKFCDSNNFGGPFLQPEIADNSNNYGVRELSASGAISSPCYGTISYPTTAQRKRNLWIKYNYPEITNSVNSSSGTVSSSVINMNAVVLWPNYEEYKGAIKRITIAGKLDLIPCLNENNQAGFYDKVNRVFKGHANLYAIE